MGESSAAAPDQVGPARTPSTSERLLWRLWVAPARERATGGPPPARRAAVSTWGGQRERKQRRPVRVVE